MKAKRFVKLMPLHREGEIWRAIEGYEGLYVISDTGNRVKTLSRKISTGRVLKEKILTPRIDAGDVITHISVENKTKIIYYAREKAKLFIKNPNNYTILNFKDGDRLNTDLKNLEWIEEKIKPVKVLTEKEIQEKRNKIKEKLEIEKQIQLQKIEFNLNGLKKVKIKYLSFEERLQFQEALDLLSFLLGKRKKTDNVTF